jgi:shikimate dehydrogenase
MQQTSDITNLYGLIGYPLSHSFSQKYFRQKFINESIKNADFLNFEMEDIRDIRTFLLQYPSLKGFAVTIPHKERIMSFLDEIDDDAKAIGAVNTVTCRWSGTTLYIKGYNTDYLGFQTSLLPFLKGHETNALILGNGGASKAVQYALSKLGISYIIVDIIGSNHKNIIYYNELNENMVKAADIIVNTTPLGTWPNINNCADIPYQYIKRDTIAYDLVYNPEKTKFLGLCENNGAIIVNGIEMLKEQAEKAWQLYNNL